MTKGSNHVIHTWKSSMYEYCRYSTGTYWYEHRRISYEHLSAKQANDKAKTKTPGTRAPPGTPRPKGEVRVYLL